MTVLCAAHGRCSFRGSIDDLTVKVMSLLRARAWHRAIVIVFSVDFGGADSIGSCVSRLTKALMLVCALLWAPITWHCQLEALPLFEFLTCCDHEDAAAPHQDSDCEQDVCAVVEGGNYKTQEHQVLVEPPALAANLILLALATSVADESARATFEDPPECARNWQFVLRAALPVRAPSFVS